MANYSGEGCGICSRRRGEKSRHEATGGSAEEKGWSEGSSVQVQPFSMDVGPTFPLMEKAPKVAAIVAGILRDA